MKRLMLAAVYLTTVVLTIGAAVTLGVSEAQAALVAKWNFNDLNDSSEEDQEDNTLELRQNARLEGGVLVVEVDKGNTAATVQVPANSEILFTGQDPFTVWTRLQITTKEQGFRAAFEIITSENGPIGWVFRFEDVQQLRLRWRGFKANEAGALANVNGKADNNKKYGDGQFHTYAVVRGLGEDPRIIGITWIDGDEDGAGRVKFDLVRGNDVYRIWGNRELAIHGLIDELRIYDTTLTDEELDKIEADPLLAVDPKGKLTTTWANLKAQ
jgi:hypothetical protein